MGYSKPRVLTMPEGVKVTVRGAEVFRGCVFEGGSGHASMARRFRACARHGVGVQTMQPSLHAIIGPQLAHALHPLPKRPSHCCRPPSSFAPTRSAPLMLSPQVEKNTGLTITGANKMQVGDFCATIRLQRPPEPYKGKGIRYAGEQIKLKEGKSGKSRK